MGKVYRYYSTQRPVDIATYPKLPDNEPINITNYSDRVPVDGGLYRAWGELVSAAPLTWEQMDAYELAPDRSNSDIRADMYRWAQFVGVFERRHRLNDVKRYTWWYSDFGCFVPNPYVSPRQLRDRYLHLKAQQEKVFKKIV